jgi:hypothetical protein
MIIPFLVLFLLSGTALAVSFGTNITISDQNFNAGGNSWYTNHEDNEVEPGMVANQGWDLEGFFLNGSLLAMIGGYDFVTGESGFMSGDIFIDVTGDAIYGDIHDQNRGDNGDTINSVKNSYGYDYVLDMNFADKSYTVYAINNDSYVQQTKYNENEGSSPWIYVAGGNDQIDIDGNYVPISKQFNYYTGQYIDGMEGSDHNVVLVDIGFLGHNIDNFTAHFTMQCGNDNLMGSTAPVPEPATLLLFGTGLIGLAGIGRKRFKK